MTTKQRNNLNHPWKKAFQPQTAIAQNLVRKELEKRGIK
jgi:hypothetical protein